MRIGCAKTAIKTCSGKVGAKIRKTRVGSKTFRKLKHGHATSVKVKLSKKGRKLVRKVKKGRKIRFAVTVVVKDARGKGRTVKHTVTVKRR